MLPIAIIVLIFVGLFFILRNEARKNHQNELNCPRCQHQLPTNPTVRLGRQVHHKCSQCGYTWYTVDLGLAAN